MDRGALYDDDIYAWAYEQAALLRRLAETRRDLPNELDLEHLAEEVEDVGRTELHRAESFLRLLLLHLLKIVSAPNARAADHWRAETMASQMELVGSVTRSIARKVRLNRDWGLALGQARAQLELEGDRLLSGLPTACPLSVDQLTAEPFDVETALNVLRAASSGEPGIKGSP